MLLSWIIFTYDKTDWLNCDNSDEEYKVNSNDNNKVNGNFFVKEKDNKKRASSVRKQDYWSHTK